ncbi:MAG: hypothetical protein GX219_03125 [Tissierellia bacterium]|nr:hypothetical protein [Tissierellia bacterium]
MEFITKDIYNEKGVLVIRKGAPVDDLTMMRLKAHGVKRLEFDEINAASVADPVAEVIDDLNVKSDIISLFDELPPTIYNRAKYCSAISRILGEWLGYEGKELDDITVLGMFFDTGIEVDLRIDQSKYQKMLEVAHSYSELRINKGKNILDTLHIMQVDYITVLDTKILLTFIEKFTDLLVGTKVNLYGKEYYIVYIFPTDISKPLLKEVDSDEIKPYEKK